MLENEKKVYENGEVKEELSGEVNLAHIKAEKLREYEDKLGY